MLPSSHPSRPTTTTHHCFNNYHLRNKARKVILFCDSAVTAVTKLHTTVTPSCKYSLGPGTPCLWSRGPPKSLCAHLLLGLWGLAPTPKLSAVRPPPLCDWNGIICIKILNHFGKISGSFIKIFVRPFPFEMTKNIMATLWYVFWMLFIFFRRFDWLLFVP